MALRLTFMGPGRAAIAIGIAATAAGHDVVAVAGRDHGRVAAAAERLEAMAVSDDAPLPAADLLILGVRDDAIGDVAAGIAPRVVGTAAAVHLSGLVSIDALQPLQRAGLSVGSFHPLQTLPEPEIGAARLPGAWVGITTDSAELRTNLDHLAASLDMHAFSLDDSVKPLYHAAAAAFANFPLAAWAMAADLMEAAEVPLEAARPLVAAVADNAFEIGPLAALTGPVARGDLATVEAQLAAVEAHRPVWRDEFVQLVLIVARLAGRESAFAHLADRSR